MADAQRYKELIREERSRPLEQNLTARSDRLPGEFRPGDAVPGRVLAAFDVPGGVDDPNPMQPGGVFHKFVAPFHAQTMGPGFFLYGPMIGEDGCVVEEGESFFFGGDGTLYSNYYVWVRNFEGDRIAASIEYVDSHHSYTVLGNHAPWKKLAPPVAPRRRWRPTGAAPEEPTDGLGLEMVFEVACEFDLDPSLLRDVVPQAAPPVKVGPGPEGNKDVIRSLHAAQAKGDATEVAGFYASDFRHFLAGERPFGWDHLPIEEIYAPLVQHLASPLHLRFGPLIADGDCVFEEMDSFARLDDGTVYNNWHCFIHEVRDGLIVETREYLDTHHVWVVLGRWADWAAVPVPPMRQARRSNLSRVVDVGGGRPNPYLDLERWRPLGPIRGGEGRPG